MVDVFIAAATRTPFGRYGGRLAALRCDDLAAAPITSLMARYPTVDWGAVDEVVLGCANQAGEDNRNVARMATLLSGLPETVPAVTVNRLCASGLEAIGQAARAIAGGDAEFVIAGGVESMSRAPFVMPKAEAAFTREQKLEDSTLGWHCINPVMQSRYGVDSMTQTADNLARERGITRDCQDAYALRSQERTGHARAEGWLAEEIAAVQISNGSDSIIVDEDEHPRPKITLEQLAKLKPLLGTDSTITAGNASGINDGACALLLASAAALNTHRLQPLARIISAAAVGVAPRIMGIGPVPAIHKLLTKIGRRLDEFDRIEINEAFAAQVLACTRSLGLADDADYVNGNGGAIALGHPLGASGARLVMTAAYALRRQQQSRALVSLCVGVGQGVALALERV
ncbi:MAG TPA: 3-oxoadipyl-CoA thiolase [Candidatus Dormibacteraeota bacterium]|nr:3-oxoadipyl-CoA thiolase [Candidatus Dormibacteraeota bacterium]